MSLHVENHKKCMQLSVYKCKLIYFPFLIFILNNNKQTFNFTLTIDEFQNSMNSFITAMYAIIIQ